MIFEITPYHINQLSDTNLRLLIGKLSEQEMRAAGHSPAAVTYGGHQNAPDGGIDVRVRLPEDVEINGYVPRINTGFQVKSEDMPPSKISKEMCPNGSLRASIQALAKSGGAYVICSSVASTADTSLDARRNSMAQALISAPKTAHLHIDFYDAQRLASWVNQHPGLIPWVRIQAGDPLLGWQPFDDWSSSPSGIDGEYFLDDKVRLAGAQIKDTGGLSAFDGIMRLREILSKPQGIVRLIGLSGVGKTRLVQALFDQRIGDTYLNPGHAIYTDIADQPDPVPLELLDRLAHLGQRCIVIIDNCGIELHRKLSNKVKKDGALISLITVEYDISEDEPEHTDVFKLEPASADIIERILERRYQQLTPPEIRTVAAFSEGNARVALALAETSRHGESLANLNDSELFKRLFRQRNQENPALLRAAKSCSLVYSFDGEMLDEETAELPILASLAEQSVAEFHSHIAELHRRQLVQKRSKWRAVLPHALADKLADQALQDVPRQILTQHLVSATTPQRLLKSFTRRIGYLHHSPQANELVGAWLAPDGFLSAPEKFGHFGMELFSNVAPVTPEATLNTIEQAFARSHDFEEHGSVHHQELARLLRLLAYDAELFPSAARLIARLVHGTLDSNHMGDPINVFKSLFYIKLSGTHASIEQRIDVLRTLALSGDERDHKLALSGLGSLLTTDFFSASHQFSFGTRKRDFGFSPSITEDVQTWFRSSLSLCREFVEIGGAFSDDTRRIVADKFPRLISATRLTDDLIVFARDLAAYGWPEGWVAVRKALRLATKAKRFDDVEKLTPLADELKPTTLEARIAAYVEPRRWSSLDVAEIDWDSEEKYTRATEDVDNKCQEIGRELAKDPDLFQEHVLQLLNAQLGRVGDVGKGIGQNCDDPNVIWQIALDTLNTKAGDKMAGPLLSGFLAGIFRKEPQLTQSLLDSALATETLHPFFVQMQCAVGIDSAGYERLLTAAKLNSIPIESFRLLAFGRIHDALNGAQLYNILSAICDRVGGVDTALEILSMKLHGHSRDEEPLDPQVRNIGSQLLGKLTFEGPHADKLHEVDRIIQCCLTSHKDEPLARTVCHHLADAIYEYRVHPIDCAPVISALSQKFPIAVLDILVEGFQHEDIGRPRSFTLFRDEAPRRAPFAPLDEETVIAWIKTDPESRAELVAQAIQPFFADNGVDSTFHWTPLAMRLLREAPEPAQVLNVFCSWLKPMSWSGSRAEVMSKRLPLLKQLANDEDQRIAQSALEASEVLRLEIEREREHEAAMARSRDERFE